MTDIDVTFVPHTDPEPPALEACWADQAARAHFMSERQQERMDDARLREQYRERTRGFAPLTVVMLIAGAVMIGVASDYALSLEHRVRAVESGMYVQAEKYCESKGGEYHPDGYNWSHDNKHVPVCWTIDAKRQKEVDDGCERLAKQIQAQQAAYYAKMGQWQAVGMGGCGGTAIEDSYELQPDWTWQSTTVNTQTKTL